MLKLNIFVSFDSIMRASKERIKKRKEKGKLYPDTGIRGPRNSVLRDCIHAELPFEGIRVWRGRPRRQRAFDLSGGGQGFCCKRRRRMFGHGIQIWGRRVLFGPFLLPRTRSLFDITRVWRWCWGRWWLGVCLPQDRVSWLHEVLHSSSTEKETETERKGRGERVSEFVCGRQERDREGRKRRKRNIAVTGEARGWNLNWGYLNVIIHMCGMRSIYFIWICVCVCVYGSGEEPPRAFPFHWKRVPLRTHWTAQISFLSHSLCAY